MRDGRDYATHWLMFFLFLYAMIMMCAGLRSRDASKEARTAPACVAPDLVPVVPVRTAMPR